MELEAFSNLKNFNIIKHFGLTKHTMKLENKIWKRKEIFADMEEGFGNIRCSNCDRSAVGINLKKESCYCDEHFLQVDCFSDNILSVEQALSEFQNRVIKLEKCLAMTQERKDFLMTNIEISKIDEKHK